MNTTTFRKIGLISLLGLVWMSAIACQKTPQADNNAVPVAPAAPPSVTNQNSPRLPQPDNGSMMLPQPQDNGDFTRSTHVTWEVTDPDPDGLNCRMAEDLSNYDQLLAQQGQVVLNIKNWPVVGTLKQGQDFVINPGPAGFGVVYDSENQPWMYVERTDEEGAVTNCFVRANSSFVQPIPTPGDTVTTPAPVAPQSSLPQPLDNGDFPRSFHSNWQVTDPDPEGLNCRMADISLEELNNNTAPLNIGSWPVVATLDQGKNLKSLPGPGGLGIVFDANQQPWMYVEVTNPQGESQSCFVRANSRFVRPI